MDHSICASLSHTHLLYEVDILKCRYLVVQLMQQTAPQTQAQPVHGIIIIIIIINDTLAPSLEPVVTECSNARSIPSIPKRKSWLAESQEK